MSLTKLDSERWKRRFQDEDWYAKIFECSQSPHICPICNGRGMVRSNFYPDVVEESVYVKCRGCGGRGIIFC